MKRCPECGRPIGHMTWAERGNKLVEAFMIFGLACLIGGLILALTGCTTTPAPTAPNQPFCDACVGPYDLRLRSHREALEPL